MTTTAREAARLWLEGGVTNPEVEVTAMARALVEIADYVAPMVAHGGNANDVLIDDVYRGELHAEFYVGEAIAAILDQDVTV